ncbi:MAG: hypothetical protein P8172_17340 [Gammaproteobacteria bacterium]
MIAGIGKTIGIDSGFLHLYMPLVRRLVVIAIATGVLTLVALLFFDNRLVSRMSTTVIENSSATVTQKLRRLFDQSRDSLVVATRQIDGRPLDDNLRPLLVGFLSAYPFLDSINVADSKDNEYVVIHDEDGYLVRRLDAAEPEVANWSRWRGDEMIEEWQRRSAAPPSERPWFIGALQYETGTRHWTEPYEFLTTKVPGISVSTRWQGSETGRDYAIAFNMNLSGSDARSPGGGPVPGQRNGSRRGSAFAGP